MKKFKGGFLGLNKIIEREMYDQLDNYLRRNDLMDKYQYGFVNGKCTNKS